MAATAEGLTGDLRQEVNTALLELDKGLRSSRVGEQCEAIVRFPVLVDRYPFPVLINAAFLKLSDLFRTGSNFLRLNIYKVVQLTQKHLHKVASSEEFLRRIFTVIHSNDPLARAITLRMFAAIATLVAEKKNVHHSIHQALDSNDQVEVLAAIYATRALCQHSGTFSSGICEKIAVMVQGLKTPLEMKLHLLPVMREMHHSLATATQVREVSLQLLVSYPSLSFVTMVIDTLTHIAIATLVQVPDQVWLLLSYAERDARRLVRCCALANLLKLALRAPQCWTNPMMEALLRIATSDSAQETQQRESELGFCVLYHLSSSSVAVLHMTSLKDSLAVYSFSECAVVAACAVSAVCNITMATPEPDHEELLALVQLTVGTLVAMDHTLATSDHTPCNPAKMLLQCFIKLCGQCSVSIELTQSLTSLLPSLSGVCPSLLCRAVSCAVSNSDNISTAVASDLTHFLDNKECLPENLLLPVATMLMEVHKGSYTSARYRSFTGLHEPLLSTLIADGCGLWLAYQIARKASMMGFPGLAGAIYTQLPQKTMDSKFHQWLCTLQQFSAAQVLLVTACHSRDMSQLCLALRQSSSLLYDCAMLVKGSGHSTSLHMNLLANMADLLSTCAQLLFLCVTHQHFMSPPSPSTSNALQGKLKEVSREMVSVSRKFSVLRHSLFDADPSTLSYVLLLQQSCALMGNITSSLLSTDRGALMSPMATATTPLLSPSTKSLDLSSSTPSFSTEYLLGQVCSDILTKTQSSMTTLQTLSLSEEHLTLLQECVQSLVAVPLLLPPSFFTSYQSTSVQLAISPPPSLGQLVPVKVGSGLTLTVEGVVEHGGKRVYRSPDAVHVKVLPRAVKLADDVMKATPQLAVLERTSRVDNDYFVTEFLLSLPLAGEYSARVETSLVDGKGELWTTGQQVEFGIIVDTEEGLKEREMTSHKAETTSSKQQR